MARPPVRFLVLGCGRFGRRAVQQILHMNPRAIIEAVDIDSSALDAVEGRNVVRVRAEAIDFMTGRLSGPEAPHWIIPTVPFHLVYHWVVRALEKNHEVERLMVPEGLGLPGEVRLTAWEVYSSLADSLCPEDCPGPRGGFCHLTGQHRERPLYRILEHISCGEFISRVVRSRQLAPGVGGIRCSDLHGLPEEVASLRGPVLLSTASPCHGVTAALLVADNAR
jgi:hypothetical protein